MKTLTPPSLNTPFEDTVETNTRPLITFFNTKDGIPPRAYRLEIDTSPSFDSQFCLTYCVTEEMSLVTSCRVSAGHQLEDGQQYFYRIKATDSSGNESNWTTSRFFLDTHSDDTFSGLIRTPVTAVYSSGGTGEANLINWADTGQAEFWWGTPDKKEQWICFDLSVTREISCVWLLGDKSKHEGRLEDYVWQFSPDGSAWTEIPQTLTRGGDSFRRILQFSPVAARYLRILIRTWQGARPCLREVILYHKGDPALPEIPASPYVLTISNYFSGTDRPFDQLLEQMNLGSVVVPYYLVSLDMLQRLEPKPVAILLSGARRWYEDMPMFEFNGVFEIIRTANVPIYGSCCGHQLIAMTFGYSFVRDTGRLFAGLYPITIKADDQILTKVENQFRAYEEHGWEMAVVPDEFEVKACSYCEDGHEIVEMIAGKSRLIFGAQFHGENVEVSGNKQATNVVKNFLELALSHAQRCALEVKM